jgi:hypothetical protein
MVSPHDEPHRLPETPPLLGTPTQRARNASLEREDDALSALIEKMGRV